MKNMNRRQFLLYAASGVGASGIGCVAYATLIEPHWLVHEMRDLPIAGLPLSLQGARLTQLSDMHVGREVSDSYLEQVFADVRARRPDIVVFTGDFMTYRAPRGESQFAQLREILSHFPKGRLETLGILGNHDYGLGWRQPEVAARVRAEAERAGIRILTNEVATVAGLDVIGVGDLWASHSAPEQAMRLRTSEAGLVLVHNPDTVDRFDWRGYRGWMLAGHTHGGQCKPPFLPAPLLPVVNRRYVAGPVQVDADRALYISRGIGHLIQARFNVRPEVTHFTLRSALTGSRPAA